MQLNQWWNSISVHQTGKTINHSVRDNEERRNSDTVLLGDLIQPSGEQYYLERWRGVFTKWRPSSGLQTFSALD